jgi:hypothetical protein
LRIELKRGRVSDFRNIRFRPFRMTKEMPVMNKALAIVIAAVVAAAAGTIFAAPPKSVSSPNHKVPPASLEQHGAGDLSGKVVETMNSGGYTYVCLEKAGRKTWVAVPEMKVAVGSTLSFQPGAVMPTFTSKTLNRTFENIVFSPGPATGGSALPPGHPSLGAALGSAGGGAPAAKKQEAIKVAKAEGANAYTVTEVHAKRSALDKKTVSVRGKVVKINKGIMDRNWIHIQDGTGDQKKGTHNLVATSQEAAEVGDIVTVTGVVAKDRDFGGGYTYSVILENAKIAK